MGLRSIRRVDIGFHFTTRLVDHLLKIFGDARRSALVFGIRFVGAGEV